MGHDRRGDPVGDIVMIRPARARKIVARHDAVWVPQSLLAEHRSAGALLEWLPYAIAGLWLLGCTAIAAALVLR